MGLQKQQKHSSDAKVQRMLSDIKSLTEEGKSDSEIRQLLGIEIRQFQRYQKRILEQEKIESRYLNGKIQDKEDNQAPNGNNPVGTNTVSTSASESKPCKGSYGGKEEREGQ